SAAKGRDCGQLGASAVRAVFTIGLLVVTPAPSRLPNFSGASDVHSGLGEVDLSALARRIESIAFTRGTGVECTPWWHRTDRRNMRRVRKSTYCSRATGSGLNLEICSRVWGLILERKMLGRASPRYSSPCFRAFSMNW